MRDEQGRFIKGHGFTQKMINKMSRPRYSVRKRIQIVCYVCREKFEDTPSRLRQGHKYCSNECRKIGVRKRFYNICEICGYKYWVWKSRQKRNPTRVCSRKCWGKFISKHWKREFAPNWQGGIYRNRPFRLRIWRKKVFDRDNYTCRECGNKDRIVEAHHMLPYSKFPPFRFDSYNGVTLCKECHIAIRGKELDYFFTKLRKYL